MAPKRPPNIVNYPVDYHHNNLPGVLYSLKSFKYMFTAANHQIKAFPNTRTSEKEQENDRLKDCEPEASQDLWISQGLSKNIITYRYHAKEQQKPRETQGSSLDWC